MGTGHCNSRGICLLLQFALLTLCLLQSVVAGSADAFVAVVVDITGLVVSGTLAVHCHLRRSCCMRKIDGYSSSTHLLLPKHAFKCHEPQLFSHGVRPDLLAWESKV